MGGAGVVVVGAVNVDLVVVAQRLPGPGETVVGGGVQRFGGGKGANAAVAAARAGADVCLVGAVGADGTGAAAVAELRADGVRIDAVAELDGTATGVALVVVDCRGENQIAVGAGANAAVTAGHVSSALERVLPGAGCVLVSTEIPEAAVEAAVRAAAAAGVCCVLNPAPVIPVVAGLLGLGPVLTPNASECDELARLLGGADGSGTESGAKESAVVESWSADGLVPGAVLAAARRVTAASGAPVVVTLGGDGVVVVAPDGTADHVPPRPAQVRDTTGAGDTFNGVLAARLAVGEELASAVRVAAAAAALSVAHVGARAGMPGVDAIEAALRA